MEGTAKECKIDLLLGKSQPVSTDKLPKSSVSHVMMRLVNRNALTVNRLIEAKDYSQQHVLWKGT